MMIRRKSKFVGEVVRTLHERSLRSRGIPKFDTLLRWRDWNDTLSVHAGGTGRHTEDSHYVPDHLDPEIRSDLLGFVFPVYVRCRLEEVSHHREPAFALSSASIAE